MKKQNRWMAPLRAVVLCASCMGGVIHSHTMDDYTGQVLPRDHALSTRIDSLPLHPNSDNLVASIGESTALHPDFGTAWDDGGTMRQMGIPYNVVGAGQPMVPITWTLYGDESDPGPWPIPRNPYIETVFDWREESDGDRHMLIIDSSEGMLYETGNVYANDDGTEWEGGCGAVFDLKSNRLRPETWTSADAAGLPIFPLLIRYDEVERAMIAEGEVSHAIRFTAQRTRKAYVWPARHQASSSTDLNRPAMGERFRLKAGYDISGFSSRMQVILRTMKKFGLIMSDNGGNWYFQGTHDDRWDDEEISTLKQLRGRDFEAVDITSWTGRPGFDINSAKVPSASGAVSGERYCRENFEREFVVKPGGSGDAVSFFFRGPAMKSGAAKITVTDPAGRKIAAFTVGSGSVSIDMGNIPHGIYLVHSTGHLRLKGTGRFAFVR